MNKFLNHILLYIGILISLCIWLDLGVSRGLKKSTYGHLRTMNTIMSDTASADMLIMGNSRGSCSYNPKVFDSILHVNSCNISVSGQKFGVENMRYHIYARNNQIPQWIILNIDYIELDIALGGYERYQYFPYMRDSLVKPFLSDFEFTRKDLYVPLYRYRGEYKLIGIGMGDLLSIYHYDKGNDYKGYFAENMPYNGRFLEDQIANGHVKSAQNPRAIKLLEEFLQEMTAQGTKVIFSYAPLYQRLIDNLNQDSSLLIYEQLAQKYNVPLIDNSHISWNADTTYFKDSNHVNKKGADLFSLKLAYDIKSLELWMR